MPASIPQHPLLKATYAALFHRIAPLPLAEAWDNVGLLVEAPFPRERANKVFVTIDLTTETLQEALIDPAVGVIVAYHPPIFSSMKQLTLSDVKSRIVLTCAASGVSIMSPHTTLDNCFNGINDWLASAFRPDVSSLNILKPLSTEAVVQLSRFPEFAVAGSGIGRLVSLSSGLPLGALVQRIKSFLKLNAVRVAIPEAKTLETHMVETIAICAGSGASVLSEGPGNAADLWLTGELSHHDVLAALARGTAVVLCEHSNTERGYLAANLRPRLLEMLKKDLSDESADVVVSKLDKDPLVVVA